jgi:acyl-CoA synthetase (AMP-forming)/AMP-acid ligase II
MLGEVLCESARRFGDCPLGYDGLSITVGKIHGQARRAATTLTGLGVRPGDAVAVQLPNRVEAVAVVLQAALLIGPDVVAWGRLIDHPAIDAPVHAEPGQICLLAYTSGTTAAPKASGTRNAGYSPNRPAGRQYQVVDWVTCSWPRFRLREFLVGAASVPAELVARADRAGIATFRCTEHPTMSSARFGDPLVKRQFTDGKGAT